LKGVSKPDGSSKQRDADNEFGYAAIQYVLPAREKEATRSISERNVLETLGEVRGGPERRFGI
jgi:hypothetical protein